MGIEQTKGHTADGSGLRGHSIGELFPYILMGKGAGDSFGWYIRSPNGEEFGPYTTTSQAYINGLAMKESNITKHEQLGYHVGDAHPSTKDKGDLLCYGV